MQAPRLWEYMTCKAEVATFQGWVVKDISAPGLPPGKLDRFLEEAGRQGWELAGTNFSYHPMILIFKRPR